MKKSILLSITLMFVFTISEAQVNYLDSYIGTTPTLTTVATSSNQLNQPRDLDFKPGTNELWVAQYGDGMGGTMDIFYNAGLPSQSNQLRHDSHSDHFFYYPPAIAFSNIGEFGAVSEIQNTNASSPTFMGPSLWLADTNIFAKIWQNGWVTGYPLGSHIDMLHQSPFSMGIAWDTLKAYWVMDGWNGNICKYDFVADHGPGYDDHSAGKIYRYSDVTWTRVPLVPSHCVLDHTNHWLYFVDGGSKKIKRMDVNSATFAGNLTVPSTANEPLAGYYNYTGAAVETIDSLSTQPCGIDYYNGRLIVSDYTNGNIYLYDASGASVTILDTIVTGHPGMMGIKVGPDGHIWCVNNTENKIYRLDAALPAIDAAITSIASPIVEDFQTKFYTTNFNVCNGNITPSVDIKNTGSTTIDSMEIHWALDGGAHTFYTWIGSLASGSSTTVSLPTGAVSDGVHQLSVMLMMVNGLPDDVEDNNMLTGSFRAFASVQSLPYTQDFSSATFPPSGCDYVHFNIKNYLSRATQSANGVGSGSMKMNNYTGPMNITGQKDYFMLPLLDFSSAGTNQYLTFDVAYAQYAATDIDELKIVASTDCGNTWTQMYDKMGTPLSTAPTTTSAYVPSSSQWRNDTVNLASLAGQSEVMLMFIPISNYGNNLYVDNIKIQTINVGIDEVNAENSFSIFPNPATSFILIQSQNFFSEVSIINILGEKVFSKTCALKSEVIDVTALQNGIYLVQLKINDQMSTRKIVKQ